MTLSRAAILQLTTDRFHVIRSRQVTHHAVQHGLHALVLERRTAHNRHDFTGQDASTDSAMDFVFGQLVTAEVFFHQLFRGLGSRFYQLLAPLFALSKHFRRRILQLEGNALIIFVPPDGLLSSLPSRLFSPLATLCL